MHAKEGPHPAAEGRLAWLDGLRGFAIFGILLVNFPAASFDFLADASTRWLPIPRADAITQQTLDSLIEGKFYSIFSLLFGISFGLQMDKHETTGLPALPLFRRRLWGLLLIGLLHLLLLWMGDILFLYAWLGFILVALRRLGNRQLLWLAAFLLALPVLLYPLRFISPNITLGAPFYLAMLGTARWFQFDISDFSSIADSLMNRPGWGHFLKVNWLTFWVRQADLFDQVRPAKVLAMFLLGLWATRQGWHRQPQLFLMWFGRYVRWLLPLSLLLNIGMAAIDWNNYYEGLISGWLKTWLYFLGVTPLVLCYVYGFVRAWLSGRHAWLLSFGWVGRMALTNYLLQSVVYLVLFRGVFLGWAGRWGPLLCLAAALILFPLQVAFSKWWLQRYRMGPAEWLWRSLTYGNQQAWKIPAA